ncbi:3230_t:CDS:2 [Entrophospora sp. SA101]|nr:575_t:CDS:2 [Entrophospora sp. SA101]CAJ0756139.1 3230_t:CDS:2 [Entrophospora sp. SA101]CAJ0893549.1 8284_t:CDS:2 [Entrophospora sp. SA101]CAJ0911896.1 14949_t:CDS:2 [Entrophospora sp. SA101]
MNQEKNESTTNNKFVGQEISNVLKEYDYGIRPGSIKVLTSTSTTNNEPQGPLYSKFELISLENIKLIIKIFEEGYLIESFESEDDVNEKDSETMKKWVNKPFESMEALLLTVSPKFGEKFHDALFSKLSNINAEQQSTDDKKNKNDND